MKKQMLTLIIGILIGAIIATGVFIALEATSDSSDSSQTMSDRSGEMPSDIGDGDFDPNSIGGERPDGEGNGISENNTTEEE